MFTVVAGTGYTGRRVLEQLPGDAALGLSRSPTDTDRPFELVDFDALESLPVPLPADYAVLYTCPPDGSTDQRLRRLVAALPHAPARFVYISTTGVYGDCRGAVVTEQAPVNPGSRMSRPRVDAEDFLRAWTDRLVILRVPGIYGPGRLPVERLRAHEPVLREDQSPWSNRVHIDDLAAACHAAMRVGRPGAIYNVSDGHPTTMTDYFNRVADAAGLPRPAQIPLDEARTRLSAGMLSYLAESKRLDNRRMREELALALRYPDLSAGLAACIAEQRGSVGRG